ncbi:MAG: A/G-specific adenine glycosylase [Clostridia bacterium]|nr:A/G-specific adenine glycosylase [Clostridia bacterium]
MTPEAAALLAWYDVHKRSMPWRDVGNPYATWVSEIMLQQTRVETVMDYFPRFMEAFPTLADLAQAPEDRVLKLWEGLGYYSRARNLHQGAKQVMAEYGGVLPRDPQALGRIRGIGEYTAGAIASIAYGVPAAAVDGNVIRVISRLRGIRENAATPSVKRRITGEVLSLQPPERPGDFNQALMDLGATVCTPGTPSCEDCPLQGLCDAFAAGDAEDLPLLPDKRPPRLLCWDVLLIRSGGRILVRQRTEAMLKGLWVFPMTEGHPAEKQLPAAVRRLTGLPVKGLRQAGEARHVFTHQIWQMRLWLAAADGDAAPHAPWRFVTEAELQSLALPTAMKAARALAFDPAAWAPLP